VEKAFSTIRVDPNLSQMLEEYGMSLELGHIYFEKERERQFPDLGIPRQNDYSEQTAQVIDTEIKAILDSQYEAAKAILTKHKKALDQGAALVLKEETIDGERLKQLLPKGSRAGKNQGVTARGKTSRTTKP